MRTWEPSHAVLLAKRLANTIGVDFSNDYLVLCMCKRVREFLVLRSKVLRAVTVSVFLAEEIEMFLPCSVRTMGRS